MALIFLLSLSPSEKPLFPHVLESPEYPPVPNPILLSTFLQSFSLFPRIPILAFEKPLELPAALKPSLLQLICKEACEPISVFHVLRPSEVGRYFLSATRECRELACFLTTRSLICWPIFIPSQILQKGVFQ